jgi:hypothetical protein
VVASQEGLSSMQLVSCVFIPEIYKMNMGAVCLSDSLCHISLDFDKIDTEGLH